MLLFGSLSVGMAGLTRPFQPPGSRQQQEPAFVDKLRQLLVRVAEGEAPGPGSALASQPASGSLPQEHLACLWASRVEAAKTLAGNAAILVPTRGERTQLLISCLRDSSPAPTTVVSAAAPGGDSGGDGVSAGARARVGRHLLLSALCDAMLERREFLMGLLPQGSGYDWLGVPERQTPLNGTWPWGSAHLPTHV